MEKPVENSAYAPSRVEAAQDLQGGLLTQIVKHYVRGAIFGLGLAFISYDVLKPDLSEPAALHEGAAIGGIVDLGFYLMNRARSRKQAERTDKMFR